MFLAKARKLKADYYGYALILSFLGFLGILYFINFYQPLVVDDFAFHNDIYKHGSFVNLLSWYYRNWTGRMQNIAVVFFALRSNSAILLFNIANVFVFAGFIWLASWVVLGRRPRIRTIDGLFTLLMLFLVWFTIPTLGDCVFWKTGSICYLWPMFFLMIFVLPYRLWLSEMQRMETSASFAGQKHGRAFSVFFAVLFFLFGVWVGFSNEQLFASAATLAFLWLVFVLWKRLGKSVPVYLYLGIAGLMAGGIIQMVSPGNYHRVSASGTGMEPKLDKFIRFFYEVYVQVGVRLSVTCAVLLFIFVPILIIALMFNRGKKYGHGKNQNEGGGGNTADNFQKGFCLAMVLASLASIAPFVLLSDFAAIRTTFFPACYVVFAAGTVVKYLLEKLRESGYYKPALAAALFIIIILFADGVHGIKNALLISDEFAYREKIIEEYKTSKGLGGVEVPAIKTEPHHTVYIYDIGNDPANWINRNVATFYGIDMIRLRQGENSTCSLQHPVVGKLPFKKLIKSIQPFDLGILR